MEARIDPVEYGEPVRLGETIVSLHPAGHMLGSAQVRIERHGQVWVFAGDYKRQHDATCQPFEPLACDTFVTESTFALPIYRWPEPQMVFDEINAWWRQNQHEGRTSVLFAYALGKAQRVLSGLDASMGPILVHGAVARYLPAYRHAGVELPVVEWASAERAKATRGVAMVIAPPLAAGTPWLCKFGPTATGMASGWMQIRGARRRRAIDRGFVLSDHADWQGLLDTVAATGARNVWATHG